MRIIVDGYNLIRRSHELSALDRQDLELGREGLLGLLSPYQRLKGHRITVVFDGREGGFPLRRQEQRGNLTVIFSRKGELADEVIKQLSSPGTVVITSDRELQSASERAGAIALEAEAFLMKLEEAAYRLGKGLEEEEEEPPPAKRKGAARRPPKGVRRKEEVLRKL
ncbi:MAG: NYN domain-containing protein [candidate division NC10 bacterium]|nr:NYN domain-containing protein [candidate division NC10 bacterium]